MPQRGIDTGLWNNPDFEDISIKARYLFLYLCTTPRGNQAGLFKITEKQIKDDTNIERQELPELFKELKVMDIEWYPDLKMVWVKQFLKHQAHSPKFLTAVAHNLKEIHYPDIIELYLNHNNTLSIPYQNGIDTVSDTVAAAEDSSQLSEDSSQLSEDSSQKPVVSNQRTGTEQSSITLLEKVTTKSYKQKLLVEYPDLINVLEDELNKMLLYYSSPGRINIIQSEEDAMVKVMNWMQQARNHRLRQT